MKATAKMWSLAVCVSLSALPQQALSQTKPSTPPSTPGVKPLVPGQGVTTVAPTPSTRVVSVEHAEPVNGAGLGGRVFATGLAEVYVRIIPVDRVKWKRERPYDTEIYLLSPGKERRLGSNFDNRVVRLGRLAAGEIILGVDVHGPDAGKFRTGPGERNPDGLRHAKVKPLPNGVVEVRFEGTFGLPEAKLLKGDSTQQEYAERNLLSDVIVQLSGGVTADAGVLTAVEFLKDPDPAVRKAAAYVLKTGYPAIAKSAGVP